INSMESPPPRGKGRRVVRQLPVEADIAPQMRREIARADPVDPGPRQPKAVVQPWRRLPWPRLRQGPRPLADAGPEDGRQTGDEVRQAGDQVQQIDGERHGSLLDGCAMASDPGPLADKHSRSSNDPFRVIGGLGGFKSRCDPMQARTET